MFRREKRAIKGKWVSLKVAERERGDGRSELSKEGKRRIYDLARPVLERQAFRQRPPAL